MRNIITSPLLVLTLMVLVFVPISVTAASSHARGAQIYVDRCALCHGSLGMGDGLMVLLQADYPETGLLENKFGQSYEDVSSAVRWGGARGEMSPLSPPWHYELTDDDIDAVTRLVMLLRQNTDVAIDLLQHRRRSQAPNANDGQRIYRGRCAICHGKNADGKGRLANHVINDPPPYNLRKSRANKSQLRLIIENGGAAIGRSEQMPPWREELLSTEIESLLMYLLSLREGVAYEQ